MMRKSRLYSLILCIIAVICSSVLLYGCKSKEEVVSATDASATDGEEILDDDFLDELDEDFSDEPFELDQDDTDIIIEEALSGTGCDYEFARRIDNDESFYVYTITKNDDILDDQLAVNTATGEIFTYKDITDEMLPYTEFSEYDPATDSSIDWTGVYGKDDIDLIVEEDEPGNFTYAFYRGYDQLYQGGAYEENHISAKSEKEDVEIAFTLSGDVISVSANKADFEYNGNYEMK